jgi:hypothetical protein
MSKPVILSEKAWANIYNQIAQNYPPSVLLIRNRMKSVLGFTSRTHEEWFERKVDPRDVGHRTKFCVKTIHLDFYNEPKRTMFMLKYSEYLDKSGITNS